MHGSARNVYDRTGDLSSSRWSFPSNRFATNFYFAMARAVLFRNRALRESDVQKSADEFQVNRGSLATGGAGTDFCGFADLDFRFCMCFV